MSIQKITNTEAATLGVSSLPNRPSAPTLYHGKALTADELRAAFDRLPLLVAERLNALIDSAGLYSEEEAKDRLAALIATEIKEGHSLADLFAEIGSGAFADYLSVDGERTLTEALAALHLPDGFADLRSYVDNPRGTVEKDASLPVSGDAVFRHTEETEERLSARIPTVSHAVRAGDALPVSGDGVFRELTRIASPLSARLSAVESAVEGLPFYFETATSQEGRCTVPNGALPYARLDRLGGKAGKPKNLLKLRPNMVLGEIYGVKYFTDENGYFCVDSGGNETGVSAFIYPSEILETLPSTVTLSARYIEGFVEGYAPVNGVSAADLVLFGVHIVLPTEANPITSKTCNGSSFKPTNETFAVGYFSGAKFALMLESGNEVTDYTPYHEGIRATMVQGINSYSADGKLLDTYLVPDAIKAIDGYGNGISDTNHNDIDFANKLFTKRNAIARISPDWNWEKNSSGQNQFYAYHDINKDDESRIYEFAECYCNSFTGSPKGAYDAWGAGDNLISIAAEAVWIESGKFSTTAELKEFLRNYPTHVVYTLKYPTVTDLSLMLPITSYLAVEPGGYLEAISEHSAPIPFTVTYQIQL